MAADSNMASTPTVIGEYFVGRRRQACLPDAGRRRRDRAAGGRRWDAAQVSRVLARLPAQPPLGYAILHRLAAAINATIRHGKS
jgi:hypothetical protein